MRRVRFCLVALLLISSFSGAVPRLTAEPVAPAVAPTLRVAGFGFTADPRRASCEAAGKVTFAGNGPGKVILEITAGDSRLSAELPATAGICLPLILHSQVRLSGPCESAFTADGYQSSARLAVEDAAQLQVIELDPRHWQAHPILTIAKARASRSRIVRVRGSAVPGNAPRTVRFRDATGEIPVHLLHAVEPGAVGEVEALGERIGDGTNLVLASAVLRKASPSSQKARPLLRTTEEVHALKPDDARAQYPVRIRGVVTSRDRNGGMVQDATRGVYVHGLTNGYRTRELGVGDFVEVEGLTVQGSFAPMIVCQNARYLGPGRLPDPVRPTWERLNNGSLDCQFVEIEGFVTEAYENSLVLLMPEGHFGIALVPEAGVDPRAYQWSRYANKSIRIRGTVFATRDNATHRVLAGSIGLGNPVLGLGEPVLTLEKQISELLQFDARSAGFHRVRVKGQVLHARERDYYLGDGASSVRFVTRVPAEIVAGDQVEVVGFPRLAGGSPVLLEAMVKRVGNAALPAGRAMPAEDLSRAHVGTLVQLEARLLGMRTNRARLMLDLQANARSLIARLERRNGELPPAPIGSRLQLTGVYAGPATDRVTGAEADSSELLLNSIADIRVLERPSWWTPSRALAVISSLIGVLMLAAVWVASLRRQVETRTVELKEQILGREHAERQHLIEAERSRLARDLHDELGTSLTEMSLLANVGAGTPPTLDKAAQRFQVIADKAVRVIDALDVIVWAVNPATDALQPMADYISSFVREFLSAAGIRCRLKVPIEFPAVTLDSQTRHNLFLAVKESLNNAARHSAATEIEFKMAVVDGCLHIAITDNGSGFDMSAAAGGMGLLNLRRRLERAGGHCAIESAAGEGTSVKMFLPLPSSAEEIPNATALHYEPDDNRRPCGGQRHDAANAARAD